MMCIKREFQYTCVRVAMTEWLPYRLVMEERVYSVDPASRVRLRAARRGTVRLRGTVRRPHLL